MVRQLNETVSARPASTRRRPVWLAAAVATMGAGINDLAVLPGHFQLSPGTAAVFLCAGIAQLAVGVAMLRQPGRRRPEIGGGLLALAVVLCWVLTRTRPSTALTWWLPVDRVVGSADWFYAALQALTALLLTVAAVRRVPGPGARRAAARLGTALVTGALLVPVAAVALAGVALATDGFTRTGTDSGRTLGAADPQLPPGSATALYYPSPGGIRLGMDVFEPAASARRPAPAAVYIHGGGWQLGDRRTAGLGAGLANHPGALFEPLRHRLTAEGFVVISIDFRPVPLAAWPAPVQDAKCGIRFLRAHATQLGLDPGRIGVWGSSGGGHLAALLGVADVSAGFDVGPYPDQSSAVQAVVDMFGPADLADFGDASPFSRVMVRMALGGSAAARRTASPVSYVTPGDAPFLILHGTDDPVIPPRQSETLARRLRAATVPVTLVRVRGAGHGLDTPAQTPSPAQLTDLVTDFFRTTLR